MHASRKLSLMLCPLLFSAAWTRAAIAQSVVAASQPAQTAPLIIIPYPSAATQDAAATAPATQPDTQPAATSTAPATMPATQPAVVAVYRPGAKFTLNFKDASIDSVLDYLSQAGGFAVIKETPIEGRVTVLSKQPVSPEESITLLNAVLKSNGYAITQAGRILHVIPRDKAKKSNLPVHFGADASQIANTDDLITQVIPVASIDATKLRADLAPMLSPDADVTANAGSNTIIVTDTSANIHRLVEIVAAVDQHHTAVNDIRVFKLKNASAAAAAKLISDIFKQTSGTQGAAGGGGPGGPGGPGGMFRQMMTNLQSSNNNSAFASGTVNASSDDRTNTLVVSGPTDTLKIIDNVVKELDADPTQTTTFFIYNLKNADAVSLQGVLNSFFGTGSGSTSGSTNRSNPYANAASNMTLNNSSSGSGFGSIGAGSTGRTNTGFGSTNTGFGNSGTSRSFGTSGINSATASANSDMAGKVFVVADPGTNALLITADMRYRDRVKAMIDELDRAVAQVLIKVLIAEVTHTNSSDIGVEWSVLQTRPNGNGTSGGSDFGLASAIAAATATGSPNGLVVKVIEDNLSATLKALATAGKLDVLSRPYILASDNQQASIMVGQTVPFVTGSDVTSVGTIINSVQYKDIGIILNVTPHINPDGLVILDVYPEVSSLTDQTVTIQAGVSAPVFDKRSALSRVGIKDGQTIIIGGLMQDQLSKTVNKIPLLGDIPYLGAVFSHTTQTKVKTELLIFLTPHVALQPGQLKDMSQQEKAGTILTPNAVGPGVFDEHLRGMERGSTTQPYAPRPSVVEPAASQPSNSAPVVQPAEPPPAPEPQPMEPPTNGPHE